MLVLLIHYQSSVCAFVCFGISELNMNKKKIIIMSNTYQHTDIQSIVYKEKNYKTVSWSVSKSYK